MENEPQTPTETTESDMEPPRNKLVQFGVFVACLLIMGTMLFVLSDLLSGHPEKQTPLVTQEASDDIQPSPEHLVLPKQKNGFYDLSDGQHFFDSEINAEILFPSGITTRRFPVSFDEEQTILISILDFLPQSRQSEAFFLTFFGRSNRVENGADINTYIQYERAGFQSESGAEEYTFPMEHPDGRIVELASGLPNNVFMFFEYNKNSLSDDDLKQAQSLFSELQDGVQLISTNLMPYLADNSEELSLFERTFLGCGDEIPGKVTLGIDYSMSKQDIADFINEELLDKHKFDSSDIGHLQESSWFRTGNQLRFTLNNLQINQQDLHFYTMEHPKILADKIEAAPHVKNVDYDKNVMPGGDLDEGHIFIVEFKGYPNIQKFLSDYPDLIEIPHYLTVVQSYYALDSGYIKYSPYTYAFLDSSRKQNIETLSEIYTDVTQGETRIRITYSEEGSVTPYIRDNHYTLLIPYQISENEIKDILKQHNASGKSSYSESESGLNDFIDLRVPDGAEQEWIEYFNSNFPDKIDSWHDTVTCMQFH